MSDCRSCALHQHGGCVHPLSDRDFDSADRTPCDLFFAPATATASPIKQEARRPWYVQQALDATRER